MQAQEFFIALHVYSLYASGFLMALYLMLTQDRLTSEFVFIKRIRLFLPIYYLFLAVVLFTGSLLLALKFFQMNAYYWSMIFSWCVILFLAIFHFKQFKTARRLRRYAKFRKISFFVIFVEIFLLFFPTLLKNYF